MFQNTYLVTVFSVCDDNHHLKPNNLVRYMTSDAISGCRLYRE